VLLPACKNVLEPEPVDLLVDELALNDPEDVENVRVGLYSSFSTMGSATIIAADLTSDLLLHNGTFTQYQELSNKQITATNSSVSQLWGSIYGTAYIANFILERLPTVSGVPARQRAELLATAHFIRGYVYFIGAHTYGGIPIVTGTNIDENRRVARSTKEEVLAFVLEEYNQALNQLPLTPSNPGFASQGAVQAALARYYLYAGQWAEAEQYASQLIANTGKYTLEPSYPELVNKDFPTESILEIGYTVTNDPGTLNELFQARREIIPSNQAVVALNSVDAGERYASISFDPQDLGGQDNGWQVEKYDPKDTDNNNIVLFRLGEMYLIRAEARAQQSKLSGSSSALEDINVLRNRAKAPLVTNVSSQSVALRLIEQERLYELAYEGHRWYDLVRTGRANEVLSAFSSNWQERYNQWPIPQSEIQRNPSLKDQQNPGY
jgi:hypothetical protein